MECVPKCFAQGTIWKDTFKALIELIHKVFKNISTRCLTHLACDLEGQMNIDWNDSQGIENILTKCASRKPEGHLLEFNFLLKSKYCNIKLQVVIDY